ncbi:glycosyltransferase family 4 protein [Pseudomonas sp. GD04087]|uniref:glycosyltransferase family 4 protein n=1 Tax=unclassified Pseudomonas TaxID=196821 RepID=UPI00244B77C6|nr:MULTISPECIES: glycosyltransferase family 4 protein [unclassified Pseudomonas]MDH0288658.1 glycosyltransferase family 4 protein [Pseudomonas sp. GD04087]MDH1049871.1 glycosyltransferase family 4 protein [Pseudomonas sp. GD03903]MDH1998138.1 glycosyltransferase family 4 protein [Pseudomonas sp. GD03691]
MRILLVCDSIDPSLGGGTAERTFQLAKALQALGHIAMLLTTDVGLTAERRAQLAEFECLLLHNLGRRFYLPLVSPARIGDWIARADVVQITGHWSWLSGLAGLLAHRHNKPYFYCPAGSLPVSGRSRLLKKFYNTVIGNRLVRDAECCMVVTDAERLDYLPYGVPTEAPLLIPNGVHLEDQQRAFPPTRWAPGSAESPLIAFLGRLAPIKGPDLLLEAFAQIRADYPTARLVMAGSDFGERASLEVTAQQLDIAGRVEFTGNLLPDSKYPLLRAADLLVIPSRKEAMSIVALEAGLMGTPVLLTDQCGFDEVEQIGGGRVVPVDATAIAEGMRQMLSQRELLAVQGQQLRKLVLQNYTWREVAQRCLNAYSCH